MSMNDLALAGHTSEFSEERDGGVIFRHDLVSKPSPLTFSSQAMRTIIQLDDALTLRLDVWATAQNLTRSDAVNLAITQMLQHAVPEPGRGFGVWAQGRPVLPERDGLVLQQALRDEWPA